jgi:hypothetical protein
VADLSPAAQEARRDLAQIMAELHQRCRISISRTDVLPITLETNDAALQAGINSLCADALRAATKQPYEVPPWYRGDDYWIYRNGVDAERHRLLAIANELDPTP